MELKTYYVINKRILETLSDEQLVIKECDSDMDLLKFHVNDKTIDELKIIEQVDNKYDDECKTIWEKEEKLNKILQLRQDTQHVQHKVVKMKQCDGKEFKKKC